jgi:hypothetical protein
MMLLRFGREAVMRRLTIVCAILLIGGSAIAAAADSGRIRLAQTSTVTNCMMTCNSQAATCQTACILPGTLPTGAATTTSNANVSTTCQLGCATQQVSCQTVCSRTSPSP